MDLEGLSPAEAGEVDLYLLDPSSEPALEECLSSPCACYCVLKRPGGCLLVLPQAAVSETALAAADDAGHVGLAGPSLATACKGISLTETGDWAQVYPARQVQVRIVDFEASVCSCLSSLTLSITLPSIPTTLRFSHWQSKWLLLPWLGSETDRGAEAQQVMARGQASKHVVPSEQRSQPSPAWLHSRAFCRT